MRIEMDAVMRIVIIEPHQVVREALQDLFASEPGFEVVAAPSLSVGQQPGSFDVALVDDTVAGALTSTTRATIEALSKRAPVIVIGFGEPAYYEEDHVASGAVGYWPKDGNVEVLIGLARAAALVANLDRACVSSRRAARTGRRTRRAVVLEPR
jgi:DNA-binding NarL/FixJ family response regulator